MSNILSIKDENGNWVGIDAIQGERGPQGPAGAPGKDGKDVPYKILTQQEYDALPTKDPNTIYYIYEVV